MSISGVDLGTILYFAAIIVIVIVVFGILSYIFKHLIHWFASGCGCVVFLVIVYFIIHFVLKLL